MMPIFLERAMDENKEYMQNIVSENWKQSTTELEEQGHLPDSYSSISIITTDSVLVCDKDGNIIDMFIIRFPNEVDSYE